MQLASNVSFSDLPERLTLAQTANALGVSYDCLLRWLKVGIGPKTFRVGRTRFVRKVELLEFIRRNES